VVTETDWTAAGWLEWRRKMERNAPRQGENGAALGRSAHDRINNLAASESILVRLLSRHDHAASLA